MDIVQRFKSGIAWYQPTTDTDSWRYFYDQCYSVDYTKATGETLKKVAWWSSKLQTSEDVGMWADRQARLFKFLNSNIGTSDFDPLFYETIQYDFVACFLNNYAAASHNQDLWQSINNSATRVLQDRIVPANASALAKYQPVRAAVPLIPNPGWILAAIPLIIYNALKSVNLSYYRPTVDTDTWAYFQNVVFELDILNKFQITYNQTYLLSNVRSPVDSGMWGTLASAAKSFLDANLGTPPTGADSQVDLAINFCQLFQFNYKRAAHNADLFKTFYTAFSTAIEYLQILKQAPRVTDISAIAS